MNINASEFIVLDVETTGLSPERNRIIELAMLRVSRGKILDRFESLINPEQSVPSFIAEYTGITNAMVFGKPTFGRLLTSVDEFLAQTKEPVIVGHNVSFDFGFLKQAHHRHTGGFLEHPFTNGTTLCTCKLARVLLPTLPRKSLKHVADYFGIKISHRHRAMGDAEATAKVLLRLIDIAQEEHDIEHLEDLLRLQYKRKQTGAANQARRKPTKKLLSLRERVRAFPERPGVYVMRGRRGDVLYVGKAINLRDRVSSYFTESSQSSSQKLKRLMKAVAEIQFEETGSELTALLLESRKIKELAPRFNTLERRYKSYTFLKLDVLSDFPRLQAVREPASDGAEYYGPFRSREGVDALIEVMNRSFKLRECGDDFKIGLDVKPCFYHEIDRCSAPCAMKQSKAEYRLEVERLRTFLAAKEDGIIKLVEKMMLDAAERLNFEEAQYLKLRLLELRRVLAGGERATASLNANDYVIMTKSSAGAIEVFFVRYGRLVKQALLGPENAPTVGDWFYRQLRMYYAGASPIPPVCGKPEVDEMRILAAWSERKRKSGSVCVHFSEQPEESVPRLVLEFESLIGRKQIAKAAGESLSPLANVILPTISTEAFRTAKRLTLKPMKKRE